ncbi:MAG: CoA-binding protein [Candidatus Eisenbacteria bacterium]
MNSRHPNLLASDEELAAVARDVRVAAVVGMKDDARAWEPAFEIPKMMIERGIEVIPVNPTIPSSLGRASHARLADVPVAFDLVDVFRRSDRIPGLVVEILALPAERRPAVVWLQSGIRNDAAALRLAEAGIRVVQDACLGVFAARVRPRA